MKATEALFSREPGEKSAGALDIVSVLGLGLNLRPRGRTLVKLNLVQAGKWFPDAYTRPEFVEGVFLALRDRFR